MYVRPVKRAYGRERTCEGAEPSERCGMFINQSNFHYRPGSTCWSSFKETDPETGEEAPIEWPLVITRIVPPYMHPDIVEVGGMTPFSLDYISKYDLDPDNLLPSCLAGATDGWVATNIPFNLSSDRVHSSWSADALPIICTIPVETC
eukprot:7081436-Prymnesium_polylepis.1